MKIEIDKPVVPQFVADAIVDAARWGGTLSTLYSVSFDHPLHDWLYENENIRLERERLLATAFIFGWEVEQPLCFAKVKGWELIGTLEEYWNYNNRDKDFEIGCQEGNEYCDSYMTKEEWARLGINDTNADFEEVE